MHDADGVPSRRCVKNSTLLRSRVEFPRKTILFFHCLLDRGRFTLQSIYLCIQFVRSHGKRHYSSDENNSPSMLRTSSIGILVPSRMVIRRSKSSTFLTAPVAVMYLPPAFRSSGWK